ncbi:bifunctional metallophosphatase/5'-nucleotidase [Paenibacillus gansuensis]|uniref:Bifunctional metallophosphatase/5'-nucleotidase n=1 Tax=Paenibacillus gansuensis TaxID=306542 RepID=A0ABW5PF43_9BACL
MSGQRLVILHTNDIHSHFEQMPRIAGVLDSYRALYNEEELLILDIGDHMDRVRLETEGTAGAVNVDVLNASGYEAVTLGNNEGLTFMPDALRQAYEGRAAFPVVCANLTERESGQVPPWIRPYHLVDKGGIRVGLIGVTAAFTPFYDALGWDVSDPLAKVRELTELLRPQADLIVVLSHLGLHLDEQMAGEIPGIDCILGAHTHHEFDPPVRMGGTVLCAAGKFGRYVGRAEFSFDPAARRVTYTGGGLIEVDSYAGAPAAAALIESGRRTAAAALSGTVAVLDRPVPLDWHGESPLGNLLAAGLARWTGAPIGLVNAGQLLAGLPAGAVTEAMLHAVCPGPINPCSMRLSGRALRMSLEESLLPEYTGKEIRGFGFRGKVLGTLSTYGLRIEVDPQAPAHSRIASIYVGDAPLDDDAEYLVGTIDMFTFRSGYLHLADGRDVRYYLPEFLRDVLNAEIRDQRTVEAAFSVCRLVRE